MARLARRDVVDPTKSQILHCTQRCVRGAFLCGKDSVTGKSFEHRRVLRINVKASSGRVAFVVKFFSITDIGGPFGGRRLGASIVVCPRSPFSG